MPFSKNFLDAVSLSYCRLLIAGLSPVMPGTCGSALAAVLAPFLFLPLSFTARVVVLALIFGAVLWPQPGWSALWTARTLVP